MKQVQFLTLIGIAGILIALSASQNNFSKKTNPRPIGKFQKIRIANVKEYSIFNLIAKEKGFFLSNGLDADVREFDAGPPAVQALLAQEVDFALASDNAGVQSIFKYPNLRIVSQFVRNKVFSVVGRKDKGIKAGADLQTKRIGVTKRSAGEFLLSEFLEYHNLKLKADAIVDLSQVQIKEQLLSGTIDAGVLFEPNVYDLLKSLGDNAYLLPFDESFDTYGLIYTTEEFIQKHPELVEQYLQSLVDAEVFFHDNEAQTKDLLIGRFGYTREYIDYSWTKNNHAIALNQELLLSMENIAQWVIANKLTDQTVIPNYIPNIYFEAIDEIKPDSVTIIH